MFAPSIGEVEGWKGKKLQDFCYAFHIPYTWGTVNTRDYSNTPQRMASVIIVDTPITSSFGQEPIIDHITGSLATEAFIWLRGLEGVNSRYEGAQVIRFIHEPLITITGRYPHYQRSAIQEQIIAKLEEATPLPEVLIDIIDKKYA